MSRVWSFLGSTAWTWLKHSAKQPFTYEDRTELSILPFFNSLEPSLWNTYLKNLTSLRHSLSSLGAWECSTLCSCPNPPTEHFESEGQLLLSTLPGSVTDYTAASFSTTWRNVTMVSAVLYSHCITFLFWGLVWFGLVSFTHGVSLHSCWCVQLWRMLVSKLLCSDVLSREINARGTCSTLLSCLPLSHCPYFMPKPLSSPN